jgi:predicted RNA-binding Zn-ribbon protein involved in translation (DUF1610 family)
MGGAILFFRGIFFFVYFSFIVVTRFSFLLFLLLKLTYMAFKINTLQNYKCDKCGHISNYDQMIDDNKKPFCHDKLCPKCNDVMIDLWQCKIYAKKTIKKELK